MMASRLRQVSSSGTGLSSGYLVPLFLLIVFLGPVILGPILNELLAPFGLPFHRIMSRALLISALGALILFRKRLRLREWWPSARLSWVQIGCGLAVAATSGAVMIGLYGLFRGFYWVNLSLGQASLSLLTAVIAALIVPLLEETIFRGFLVTSLTETMGRPVGWILAALIYMVAHFLRFPSQNATQPIQVWSGATGIFSMVGGLGHGDFLSWRGLNLFLVGLILGGIFLHSGTLWLNAGLHAGWILVLMIFTAFARPMDSPYLLWLGADLSSSPLTSGVLVTLGLLCLRFRDASARANSVASSD